MYMKILWKVAQGSDYNKLIIFFMIFSTIVLHNVYNKGDTMNFLKSNSAY